MADRTILPIETLRQLIAYDPATGALTWLRRPDCAERWNTRWAGKPALTAKITSGYAHGTVQGVFMMAHRVAFAIHHGFAPDTIDHINGDRTDNRIDNLRAVTPRQNSQNQSLRSNNKSGVIGVSWVPDRNAWLAMITNNGKQRNLGYYKKFEDAVAARKAAEKSDGFHPNHGRVAIK